MQFQSLIAKIPWRRKWQPTPVFFFFLSSLKFFYFFFPDRSAQPGKARAWAPAGWGPCLGSPAQHWGCAWATWCLFISNLTTESNFSDPGGSPCCPCWCRRHSLVLIRLLGFLQSAIVFMFFFFFIYFY